MSLEIIIYISIAIILFAARRVISGMKNGVFYGKGRKPLPEKLAKYIKNIHFLETPAWYTEFGGLFFMLLAVFRAINPTLGFWDIGLQLLSCILITMGCSGMSNYHYQGYINHGSGLPWVDPNENPKSEFAFGPISFWWKRPWHGKRRKWIIVIGTLYVVGGLLLATKIH